MLLLTNFMFHCKRKQAAHESVKAQSNVINGKMQFSNEQFCAA